MKPFDELIDEANEHIAFAGSDFDAFSRCGDVLQRLISERLHMAALHNLLLNELEGRPTLYEISSGEFLILSARSHSFCALLRHTTPATKVYFVPNHSASAHVSGPEIIVQRLRSSVSIHEQPFSRDLTIDAFVPEQPARGQVFFKNGTCEALNIFGTGPQPSITLRLNSVPFGSYEVEADTDSFRRIKRYSLSPKEDNLLLTFELLGDVRASDSLAFIEPFARHELHQVRWKAIQTIAKIDRAAALDYIVAATQDIHPDVRAAAELTVANL